jgi:D-serine deaminase-like pyridoxal phosphate-dependent protein
MARWCHDRGVELAPHGKTHMAPQLFARHLDAGACGITAATLSHVRTYRAFGVRDVLLTNELVDGAGLRWLAAELDAHPDFSIMCWWIRCRGSS